MDSFTCNIFSQMMFSLILQGLFTLMLLSPTLHGLREEAARDLLEDVLRIPNSRDRLKNSVLQRLGRTLQQELGSQQNQQQDCDDTAPLLPEYTESIKESYERGSRQLGAQRHYPICHLKRRIRRLNTEVFEYRPAYYEEVHCLPSSSQEEIGAGNEICSSLGFSCVQWNKTIHLTRRKYNSECWETKTMIIPAGCECMWPVHRLGDIMAHDYNAAAGLSD